MNRSSRFQWQERHECGIQRERAGVAPPSFLFCRQTGKTLIQDLLPLIEPCTRSGFDGTPPERGRHDDSDTAIGTTATTATTSNTSNNDKTTGSQGRANGHHRGQHPGNARERKKAPENCRDCERLVRANAELSRLLRRTATSAVASPPLPPSLSHPPGTAATSGDGPLGAGYSSAPTVAVVGTEPAAGRDKGQPRRIIRKTARSTRISRTDGSGSPNMSPPVRVKPSSPTVVRRSTAGQRARK